MYPAPQLWANLSTFAYNDPVTSDFLTRLPKAELHLHLEGSVDPLTLSQLSEKHHTPFPWASNRYKPLPNSHRPLTVDEAAALYDYTDFTGFLMAFKAVTERLRDPEDFELITYRLVEKLAAQGCLHAEVFVSVGVIFWRGQEFDPLFEGLERGRIRGGKRFRRQSLLDLRRRAPLRRGGGGKGCCHGHPPGPSAAARAAAPEQRYPPRGGTAVTTSSVIGIGIGGDERLAAPELFAQVYAQAARAGLRLSVHAGETVGPPSIRGALDSLGAERLGHALCAADDSELLARIVREQVPLELCLTSNLRTIVATIFCNTRCGASSTRAHWSPSTPTTPRCSRRRWFTSISWHRMSSDSATTSCASWLPTPFAPPGCRRSASASC